ncbi:hypothetical protein, partial [Saccharophagus degradans]
YYSPKKSEKNCNNKNKKHITILKNVIINTHNTQTMQKNKINNYTPQTNTQHNHRNYTAKNNSHR